MPGLIEPYDDLTGAVQQVRLPTRSCQAIPFLGNCGGIKFLAS
jgi:hypothetical protein